MYGMIYRVTFLEVSKNVTPLNLPHNVGHRRQKLLDVIKNVGKIWKNALINIDK